MHCTIHAAGEFTMEAAREGVMARISLSEGKSYPCLIDIRKVKNMSRRTREYLGKEGSELITAGALIIDSPVSRTIGNIFLVMQKPIVPVRLFTDEQAAIAWLNQFPEKESE